MQLEWGIKQEELKHVGHVRGIDVLCGGLDPSGAFLLLQLCDMNLLRSYLLGLWFWLFASVEVRFKNHFKLRFNMPKNIKTAKQSKVMEFLQGFSDCQFFQQNKQSCVPSCWGGMEWVLPGSCGAVLCSQGAEINHKMVQRKKMLNVLSHLIALQPLLNKGSMKVDCFYF